MKSMPNFPMPAQGGCPRVLALIVIVFLFAIAPAFGQSLEPGQVAVAVDNGNNLREYGGPDYKNAKIVGTLDAGDWVRVLAVDDKWVKVARFDGKQGFVNAKCLVSVQEFIAGKKSKEDFVCSRDLPRRFAVDLGSGLGKGTVVLEDVPDLFGGGARIKILDGSGKELWLGPIGDVYDTKSPVTPLYFYCHHSGVSWPELVGDLDGSGQAGIIAPLAHSDVSVGFFNFIRFDGRVFEPVFSGRALIESPKGSGKYVFTAYEGDSLGVRWIMSFTAWRGKGQAEAEVYEYSPRDPKKSSTLSLGKALVRLIPTGAEHVSWISPMRIDK